MAEKGFVDLRDLKYNTGGRQIIIVLSVFIFFDFLFIGIRLYARRIQRKVLEINDWAILIGFTFLFANFWLEVVQIVHAGLGLDLVWIITYLGADRYSFLKKTIFATNILWNLTIMAIKISILHLYLTLFGSIKTMKRLVWGTVVLTVMAHTAFIFEIFLLCRPMAYYWDLSLLGKGTCGTPRQIGLARFISGLISCLIDAIIFALPLPILWSLRMPFSKKLATSAVFGIGFGIVVVSAFRLQYAFDPSEAVAYAITGTIEPMFGIIVGCTPQIQPVVAHLSGGRIVLWATKRNNKTITSLSTIKTGDYTQKSYISTGKVSSTRGFERIEDDDIELAAIQGRKPNFGRSVSVNGKYLGSLAEEGRIAMVGEVVDRVKVGAGTKK